MNGGVRREGQFRREDGTISCFLYPVLIFVKGGLTRDIFVHSDMCTNVRLRLR